MGLFDLALEELAFTCPAVHVRHCGAQALGIRVWAMTLTFADFSNLVVQAIGAVTGLLATVMPLLLLTYPLWGPLLLSRMKDEKMRQAMDAVSQACLQAVNAALKEYRAAMEHTAGKPLPEDVRHALAVGIATAVKWLQDHALWDKVTAIYGGGDSEDARHRGEDAIRNALTAFVLSKFPTQEPAVGPALPVIAVKSVPTVTTTSTPVVA
jgi:hypothetical protein